MIPAESSGAAGGSVWFAIATFPARLIGRVRADLRASIAADELTFHGRARTLFIGLAALAIVYPVLGSIFHVVDPPIILGDPLELALRPFWDVAYAESLPFLIVASLIGAYSPALGVLLVLALIPSDLAAAAISRVEVSKHEWQVYPSPVIGRAISYALLWILAVEIPLLARVGAFAFGGRAGARRSIRGTAARVAVTAIGAVLWGLALPWLIQPVFLWSEMQSITPAASAPTWVYWWLLALGATVAAAAADVWHRPVGGGLVARAADAIHRARTTRAEIGRQVVAVVVLGALLAGAMQDLVQAGVILAGLFVAGPILTPILPRVPIPGAVAAAPRLARWVAAMVAGLAIGYVILALAGDRAYESYLPTAFSLGIAAPVFRIVLDGGRPDGKTMQPSSATAVGAIVILVAGLTTLVLIAPPATFANDCPASSELRECLQLGAYGPLAVLGLLAAALGGVGAALYGGALYARAAADAVNQADREIENDKIFRDIDESIARRSSRPPASPRRNRR